MKRTTPLLKYNDEFRLRYIEESMKSRLTGTENVTLGAKPYRKHNESANLVHKSTGTGLSISEKSGV